jgi:hypothetical protein
MMGGFWEPASYVPARPSCDGGCGGDGDVVYLRVGHQWAVPVRLGGPFYPVEPPMCILDWDEFRQLNCPNVLENNNNLVLDFNNAGKDDQGGVAMEVDDLEGYYWGDCAGAWQEDVLADNCWYLANAMANAVNPTDLSYFCQPQQPPRPIFCDVDNDFDAEQRKCSDDGSVAVHGRGQGDGQHHHQSGGHSHQHAASHHRSVNVGSQLGQQHHHHQAESSSAAKTTQSLLKVGGLAPPSGHHSHAAAHQHGGHHHNAGYHQVSPFLQIKQRFRFFFVIRFQNHLTGDCPSILLSEKVTLSNANELFSTTPRLFRQVHVKNFILDCGYVDGSRMCSKNHGSIDRFLITHAENTGVE